MSDIILECPQCHQSLAAPDDMQGMTTNCPKCQRRIQVPIRLGAPLSLSQAIPPVYAEIRQAPDHVHDQSNQKTFPPLRPGYDPVPNNTLAWIAALSPLLMLPAGVQHFIGQIMSPSSGLLDYSHPGSIIIALVGVLGGILTFISETFPERDRRTLEKQGFNVQSLSNFSHYWENRARLVGGGWGYVVWRKVSIGLVISLLLATLLVRFLQ